MEIEEITDKIGDEDKEEGGIQENEIWRDRRMK